MFLKYSLAKKGLADISGFGCHENVESYVLLCSVCNQNNKNKCYGKVPLTEYQTGAPMERVHIDFIGPLPKT